MIFVDKRLTAKHLLVFLLAASLTGCTESVPVPENTKTAAVFEVYHVLLLQRGDCKERAQWVTKKMLPN